MAETLPDWMEKDPTLPEWMEEEEPLRQDWGDAGGARAAAPEPTPAERLRGVGRKAAPRDPGFAASLRASFAQGGLKGGSDEALGGLVRLLGPEARADHTGGDIYRKARDSEREVLAGAREHRPWLSVGSDLVGDISSDVALSLLGVPGVGSSAYNVATGALSGLMRSDAELTPEKVTPRSAASATASTALGAGLGYVAPKLGERLARLGPRALGVAQRFLERRALNAGRRTLLSGADQLAQRVPTSDAAVREAIEQGTIVPFGTTAGAAQRLERVATDLSDRYGALIDELEAAGVTGPDATVLARELYERADELMPTAGVANPAIPGVFSEAGDRVSTLAAEPAAVDALVRLRQLGQGIDLPPAAGRGALGLRQAEAVKRGFQDQARYGRIEDTPINEAKRGAARIIREANERAVQNAADAAPEGSTVAVLGNAFAPVKQRLARTLEAETAAQKGAAASAKRATFGLPEYMALAGGLASSGGDGPNLTSGAGAMLASSLLRRRGPSTIASTAYGLSRAVGAGARASPDVFGRAGAEAGAALGRNTSPAVAEFLRLVLDDEPEDAAALEEALRNRTRKERKD